MPIEFDDSSTDVWIAIQPMSRSPSDHSRPDFDVHSTDIPPPSFDDSQFATILRSQRQRPADNSGIKDYTSLPSRFLNLTNSFEFSGWGSISRVKLSHDEYASADAHLQNIRSTQILGQFTGSALAGNAVLGGIFYTLPAVIAVGGIYSPISLFFATLVLFLWRPIMQELASALPISGAPYTYLLNVSTKSFALIGASLLLLDFASTSIISAATAATYLAGEVPSLPFPAWVASVLLLLLFLVISLMGMRESSRISLIVLALHLATMAALIVASAVHWGKIGNDQLKANWNRGRSDISAKAVARQIFYGFSIGMIGLTGFECTPAYVSRIQTSKFPLVLRNIHIPTILLNTIMMTLVFALIPSDLMESGANILSILAQMAAGRWLRIWIVVDAIIVLSGGVLTGILSACELLEQLSLHRIIPKIFLHLVPSTGSPYVSVILFVAFSGTLYASTGANLSIISLMFTLVWLTVMSLFPLSLLMLKFNRGRIQRESKTRLIIIFAALFITVIVFAGNIAINPQTAGYFAAYFLGVVSIFSITQNKIHLLRCLYWTYDQYPWLHRFWVTKTWGDKLIALMKKLRRLPVCILVKTDEINNLFHMVLYVQKNEETSYLKIIHFYDQEDGIPSELEANSKILDEAFPEITIDLLLIDAAFEPRNVAALANKLGIPNSLMFMTCPGENFRYSVAELGTRIITL